LVAELAEVEHLARCTCLMCAAKRWLRYTPEEDRYPVGVTLKIASYSGTGGGSHEPDAHFDAVVTEADFRRALALIPSERLRHTAHVWMETPYPLPVRHGPRTRREAVMGKLNVDQGTLDRQIDDCAREMALVMGERHDGRPNHQPRLSIVAVEAPDPVKGVTYR
jgi:hypothetical protein